MDTQIQIFDMIKVTELFHLILSIWDYSQCCHFPAINLLPKKYRLNNFNLSYISQFYIFLENLFSVCYENFQSRTKFQGRKILSIKKISKPNIFLSLKCFIQSLKCSKQKIFQSREFFKAEKFSKQKIFQSQEFFIAENFKVKKFQSRKNFKVKKN